MARFRLRFLLQELDLIGPVVTLGRSSECQITLDDPLVSRVHAQLTVTDSDVRVRDLGSRNGVRVNDQLIDREVSLRHHDRLRLGTQDLVFLAVADGAEAPRLPRATGSMAHCRGCGRPFPGEAANCPHCGTPGPFNERTGPDTITAVEPQPSGWTFRLIAEVIERALTVGRVPEAERMLERCSRDLEARMRAGTKIGPDQLGEAARFALRLAKLKGRPEWAAWVVQLYRRAQLVPPAPALDLLEALDAGSLIAVRPELEALLVDRGANEQHAAPTTEEQRIAALVRRAAG